PAALWAFGQGRLAVLFCVLALLLWWKHAPNIRRLAAGTEGRIGQKG
ncbi:glycerol-3-phosphate acyltransferase, partial [Methylobacterium frigidaeris]